MKKTIYIVIALLIVVLSCNDAFTETVEVGALSDEALQNEAGINLLLVGAYSALDGIRENAFSDEWTSSGDNWWMDTISDDAHKGSTDGDQADLYALETFNWSTGNPYLLGKWTGLFSGVNRANNVLSVIGKVTEGDFTQQEAEARFLRAHFNFELQRAFGNVPFISVENFNNGEFNQPNTGPIWDQIELDFQFAIDNLPANQEEVGRPIQLTAKAYKAKVHLYQSEWSEASTLFNDVISSGKFALLSEFADNFRFAGDNSEESLFAIQFTADAASSPNGNQGGMLNFPNAFGFCCGFYQPSQDLVNSFQTDGSGLPLLDTFNQTDVTNDYGISSDEAFTPHTDPLDPRLDYTVGRRGIDYNNYGEMVGKDWIRANFSDISGPYLPKKNVYYHGEDANVGTGGWGQQQSGINYHIIRYADVLLMAAEAAVELNNLSLALEYVNQVRNRAKNMTFVQNGDGTGNAANYEIEPYVSFPSQDFARKAVRHERRLELSMEGHRLFDLRRWGNGVQVMNAYFENEARVITSFSDDPSPYDSKHDLLPIPITAIDLSGGTLTQNPGF
ncbi:RagB/SusD family nutrient uptake outer membrane protein [Aquimarina sediminis]|uniref:RagB/SusD family nutrient uptake outer membrane protein n=1 Tax=Aquimarina sediminis TaxID=2070536 RepID=UPI000CA04FC4|nr:RagB/SusD family nutrient uptake outer membrane protein [Aquimarina sediminis]